MATNESYFSFSAGTITSYLGPDLDVDIPSTIGGVPVTTIGDNCFKVGFAGVNITSVIIPSSVTTINSTAFDGCNISELIIPDTVTSLPTTGYSGFATNCPNLATVRLPSSTSTIAPVMFDGSPVTTFNNVPANMTIGAGEHTAMGSYGGAFASFYNANSKVAGDYTYASMYWTSPSISEPWPYTEEAAFTAGVGGGVGTYFASINSYNNAVGTGGTSPSIPPYLIGLPVKDIGNTSFSTNAQGSGAQVTTVTFPDSLESIGWQAFRDNILTELVLPEGFTTFSTTNGGQNFVGCGSLTSITLPSTVTSIPSNVFSGDFGVAPPITSIIIHDNVTITDDASNTMGTYHDSFVSFYTSESQVAGLYTYDQGTWSREAIPSGGSNIISLPETIVKGTTAEIGIDKAALAALTPVSSDAYFQSSSVWKYIVLVYKSPTRDQKEHVLFDATVASPVGNFDVSQYFEGSTAEIDSILIKDFDGGRLSISRAELTTADFDITFS
jgi:hypothetical protein